MNTIATTSFVNLISELTVSAHNLIEETNIAFNENRIPESEYEGYIDLRNDLYDLINEFNIGETGPNDFLRDLYDITKYYEILGNTKYTRSMYDLLATTYVELVEINLCRKDA